MTMDPSADNNPRWQAVVDRSELRDLAMQYARAIDRRDKALLLSCYHEDAIDDHGTVFKGPAADFVNWQPEGMASFDVTAHYIMNTDYCLDGDKAEGEIYFIAYHRTLPPEPREVIVGGRYLDHYEKREGQWRIKKRKLVWDFSREDPVTEKQQEFLESLGVTGAGEQDISHSLLGLFGKRV